MAIVRTTIELLETHIEKCPDCGEYPYIGYRRWNKEPFICGCPACRNTITSGKTIIGAIHKWNKYALSRDEE